MVLDAFIWCRTGLMPPQTPQWCTNRGGLGKVRTGALYSQPKRLGLTSKGVFDAACQAKKVQGPGEAGIMAIIDSTGRTCDN